MRLYGDLAYLWPLVSPREDYAAEAAWVRDILDVHAPRGAAHAPGQRWRILELGSGAGHTLWQLGDEVDAAAVDLAGNMLALSRAQNPGVRHVLGDMRDVRLGETFDAVLLHDAVDYMLSEADLAMVAATAAAHLAPGGVFLLAPTYVEETFDLREREADAASGVSPAGEPIELRYLSMMQRPEPSSPRCELVLVFILREGAGLAGRLSVIEDRHPVAVFPIATWLRVLDEAGFDATIAEFLPSDRSDGEAGPAGGDHGGNGGEDLDDLDDGDDGDGEETGIPWFVAIRRA